MGIAGTRAVLGRYLRDAVNRGALVGRRALIAGDSDELRGINPREILARFGIMEVGRVTLSNKDSAVNAAEIDRLIDLSRSQSADEIVLALNWKANDKLEFVRHRLRISALPVRLLPDRNVQSLLELSGRSRHSLVMDLQRQPLSWMERATKRAFDLVGAFFLLMMLLPLLLAVVVAIKFDSAGPAIFKQRRKGFNGKPFVIYKFRTMTVLEDGPVVKQAQKGDLRVTRYGRVLRRTSIDELPQLINVLQGEMSLIGPRPHALAHDDKYGEAIAGYAFRHHMKPGITGWAQINGCRGETSSIESMEERIKYDLWYINNWSFWLDMRILFRSGVAVFGDPAAY
jgi:Undecaprenyl-phosphate glucose phosphotransferase